jgi:hypothetical protein
MAFLVAAVILVGLLCAADLFLTFAVLRRLREHTTELDRLARLTGTWPSGHDTALLVGKPLPDPVLAHRPRLVGIFDANCSTCFEHAPQFATEASRYAVVAVVNGSGPGVGELAGLLAGVPAVTGNEARQVVAELAVQAFPTFLRVAQDGTIEQAHAGPISDMAEPAVA